MAKRTINQGKLWLLGVASCAAVWIAAPWGPTRDADHTVTSPEHAAETSLTATPDTTGFSEREAMRARMDELERKLAAAAAAPTTVEAKAPAPMPTRDDVERSEFLQQASVASRLDDEPVDEAWRGATESKLREALKSNPEPDAVVLGVRCRSSHCSMQLNLQAIAPEDRQLAVSKLMSTVPWNSQAFYQPDALDSNNQTGTLYLSREGRDTALQSGQLAAK